MLTKESLIKRTFVVQKSKGMLPYVVIYWSKLGFPKLRSFATPSFSASWVWV